MTAGATVAAALAGATARLAAAGLAEARADAEVLLAHVLATDRGGLIVRARQSLDREPATRLEALLVRRLAREPVFQLVGRREFWSLEVAVDRRVLCPRPESELLVETAVALAPAARRVLDCGTGSGAIAAALARELPRAQVMASDQSGDAVAVAAANLARLAPAVRLVRADWLSAFRAGVFDLVVANPPYVDEEALEALAPEVRDYEPRAALDGGPDGLGAIRILLATAPRVLGGGGWLVMEVGLGQRERVQRLAAHGAFDACEVRRDAAGIERVVAVRRHGEEEARDG